MKHLKNEMKLKMKHKKVFRNNFRKWKIYLFENVIESETKITKIFFKK